jgi:uncharacterized protein (TIGR03437 family)
MYVSPGQINLQAPDDTARGTVPVVVTTAAGSVTTTVTLSDFGPSFSLFEDQTGRPYVAGIIVRKDGSGAYGGGTYDILGPAGNALGFATVAAAPGDTVELFGVGFGPTKPPVAAGKPFSGAAPVTSNYKLYINRVAVDASFVGLSGAGLYQVNLTVPQSVGGGDVPIRLIIGGSTQTQPTVFFPLAGNPAGSQSYPGYPGYGGFTSFPGFYFGSGFVPVGGFSSPGGFTSGGFSGGFSGGSFGASAEVRPRRYSPKLPSAPK